MRARHVVTIACVALLFLAASAGADEFGPPAPTVPEPVAAGPAEAPAPTPTVAAELTPTPPAVPGAAPEATPTPVVEPIAEATPTTVTKAAESTPAPTPAAVPAAAAEATPTPIPMAVAEPAPSAQQISAPGPKATAAQDPAPPEPAPAPPSECATPIEDPATGECRVSAAVCSILGTDGDDVLTGSPFDDILCGLGGNDRLDGGDGDDVLLGGDGDDVLVGGEGDDCMVGGPGTDRAENTEEEYPEVERSADVDPLGFTEQYAFDITFDAAGKCTGAGGYGFAAGGMVVVERPTAPASEPARIAPAGAAPVVGGAAVVASSSPLDGLRLRLSDGRLVVRRGVVRAPVSCSAVAPAELVLLAGSRRIAHKRFTCTPPEETVRVRLNDAGRRLVARDERVRARLLVLAAGRTLSRQVLLVSRG